MLEGRRDIVRESRSADTPGEMLRVGKRLIESDEILVCWARHIDFVVAVIHEISICGRIMIGFRPQRKVLEKKRALPRNASPIVCRNHIARKLGANPALT